MPKVCPSCGSKYISGFKAGTQKIEAMVAKRFPQARILRMDYDTTRAKDAYEKILQAFSIIGVYLMAVILSVMMMSFAEELPIEDLIFEAVSAIGTVGLTTGITPTLTGFSKVILALLMFSGRVGAFSLLSAIAEKKENPPVRRPNGKILIG